MEGSFALQTLQCSREKALWHIQTELKGGTGQLVYI